MNFVVFLLNLKLGLLVISMLVSTHKKILSLSCFLKLIISAKQKTFDYLPRGNHKDLFVFNNALLVDYIDVKTSLEHVTHFEIA